MVDQPTPIFFEWSGWSSCPNSVGVFFGPHDSKIPVIIQRWDELSLSFIPNISGDGWLIADRPNGTVLCCDTPSSLAGSPSCFLQFRSSSLAWQRPQSPPGLCEESKKNTQGWIQENWYTYGIQLNLAAWKIDHWNKDVNVPMISWGWSR